jgi:23S rRNA (guanosine2251-2'-O)-methyltransferase
MTRHKPPRQPPRPSAQSGQPARHHKPAPAQSARPGLLFGLHPVAAAWINPERRVHRLLATEAALAGLAAAMEQAKAAKIERPVPTVVERTDLDRLLPAGAVHQGLVLDAAPLPEVDLGDIIREGSLKDGDLVVLLDQVTDPHNVGAILRSASAFGASAVVLPDRNAPEMTGTLAKSASGAAEVVPLVRVVNLSRSLTELREAGYLCVGLDESGGKTLAQLTFPNRVALVLGAEGSGLRRLTMERCDEIARLPTSGPIGSLNVSNAAAVALYELARLR